MKPRGRDRTLGLSILGVAFLGSLCISWWASVVSAPERAPEPAPATVEGVLGFPTAVQALATLTLETARGLTVRQDLAGIVLDGVASDGTVNVGDGGTGRIRFVFQSARGEGPQPPRPKGTLPKLQYCGRQNVVVGAEGIVAERDDPSFPCGSKGGADLPDPRCGPAEVWRYARDRKRVPAKDTARIEYYRSKAGPAWRFQARRTRFSLYGDCERELSSRDAVGSAP
jgi:hypothetical protein